MESLSKIIARVATIDDALFVVHCNVRLARESEDLLLDLNRVREGVDAVFNDRGKGFYLVAEVDGRRAGQLLITYEWSDWRNGVFWWIQSVYTIPEFRNRGVFRALYSHVELLARQAGTVCGLRLYVAPSNEHAQAIYRHRGLHDSGYRLFERDYILDRTVTSGSCQRR